MSNYLTIGIIISLKFYKISFVKMRIQVFFHLEGPPSQVELVGLKGFQIFSKSSKIIVFHLSVPREAVTLEALVIQRGRVERDVEGLVEEFKGSHIVAVMDHLVVWISKISFFCAKKLLKIFVTHRIVLVERQTGEVRCKLIMNLQQNKNRSVPNYQIEQNKTDVIKTQVG